MFAWDEKNLIEMVISTSLLCVFAICAIFLNNPSARALPSTRVNTSKRYVSMDSVDKQVEMIDLNDPRHPIAMCKNQLGVNDATWLALELGYMPHDICSENLLCGVPKSGKTPIILNEKPPDGSQCSTNEQYDDFREACEEGLCIPFVPIDIRKVINATQ